MADRSYILFAGDAMWRLVAPGAIDEIVVDREAHHDRIAAAVVAKLRQRGYAGTGVVLALPASWCLSAVISTAGLPRQDRAAMSFRLEEKLPLAAEQFTADFVVIGERALGACCANDKVRPLVDAMEAAGAVVQSIAPAILLAAQDLLRGQSPPSSEMLLWGEDGRVNLILLEYGRPAAWSLAPDDPHQLAMYLDMALTSAPATPAVVACEVSSTCADALRERGYELKVMPAVSGQAAARIAPEVLAGAVTPWIELRRGAMAARDSLRAIRKGLNAALAAATILCVILAAGFIYRASRYDRLARDDERALADAFKVEFPGIPLPVNPQLTLESEKRKRVGSGASALPPEARESALRIMRDTLAKLPANSTLSIDKMTFNPTSLQLEGTAGAHDDVDALVNAARAAGMDVPLPRMRKDSTGRWSFFIQGSKPAAAPVAEVE